MQCYIVFFCFIAVAVATPITTLREIHDKCQHDPATHVHDSVFEKMRGIEKVDEPKLGVHFLCMSKGRGLQTENGDIDIDGLKKELEAYNEDIRNKVVAECGQRLPGSTAVDTAITLVKCLRSHLNA